MEKQRQTNSTRRFGEVQVRWCRPQRNAVLLAVHPDGGGHSSQAPKHHLSPLNPAASQRGLCYQLVCTLSAARVLICFVPSLSFTFSSFELSSLSNRPDCFCSSYPEQRSDYVMRVLHYRFQLSHTQKPANQLRFCCRL